MNHLRRNLTALLSLGSITAKLQCANAAPPLDSSKSVSANKATDPDSVSTQTMEKFFLSYELTGAGWAHAKVSTGPATHETDVSYLTRDPLGLLAQALVGFIWPEGGSVFIINRPGQKPLDPDDLKTRSFLWEDEPGGWKWTLRPHGTESVQVKIEERSSKNGGQPLVDSIFSLREMAIACATSLEGLLVKHGIVGYQLDWTYGELPVAQYLLLKRWLQNPGYVTKASGGGTWKEDMAALRLIDG